MLYICPMGNLKVYKQEKTGTDAFAIKTSVLRKTVYLVLMHGGLYLYSDLSPMLDCNFVEVPTRFTKTQVRYANKLTQDIYLKRHIYGIVNTNADIKGIRIDYKWEVGQTLRSFQNYIIK